MALQRDDSFWSFEEETGGLPLDMNQATTDPKYSQAMEVFSPTGFGMDLHRFNTADHGDASTTHSMISTTTMYPRATSNPYPQTNLNKTFACVEMQYFLNHMQKPKCSGVEAPVISEVRRHLKRSPHKISELERCHVCDEDFLSRAEFQKHEQPHGWCQKRKLSPENQWSLLYQKVNQTEETPPSPYNGEYIPQQRSLSPSQTRLPPSITEAILSQERDTQRPPSLGSLAINTRTTELADEEPPSHNAIIQRARDLVFNLTQSLPEEQRRDTRYRVGAELMSVMNTASENVVPYTQNHVSTKYPSNL
ncbi:unnamed protein product [Periconia digitata]|uniref:C2H2-type domain-containing protein n=1 Tax=Periconia digitata TaxID=1303443 RepID=A0A9W4U538_9PLEO|nr:unnamed protein product [Periconia digitata]